jgi:hypothetical protein
MLNLDQDKFITDYVTTFLATRAANRYVPGSPDTEIAPVGEALNLAREAWCRVLEYGFGPVRRIE